MAASPSHAIHSRYRQEAALQEVRAAFPAAASIHRHVLPDVVARPDRTDQTFIRRVQAGRGWGTGRGEPSAHRALARVECQSS
jgi:hypothetical protein